MADSVQSSTSFRLAEIIAPQKEASAQTASSGPLKKACQDFESIFIQQMLQQMRRTVPRDDLFGGGRSEEIVTSMLDGELSKSIAQQRGIGLAGVLFRQLGDLSTPPGEDQT